MSDSCLVCGNSLSSEQFGNYCSKDCRDSDVAVLGRTVECKTCSKLFKTISNNSYCPVCREELVSSNIDPEISKSALSAFEYSIFEDNLQRIIEATNYGDKRNCIHAAHVISQTISPEYADDPPSEVLNSSEKTLIWLIELMASMRDKRVIKPIENYMLGYNNEKVQAKAIEALNLLKQN